jgi:hypothetical protein
MNLVQMVIQHGRQSVSEIRGYIFVSLAVGRLRSLLCIWLERLSNNGGYA